MKQTRFTDEQPNRRSAFGPSSPVRARNCRSGFGARKSHLVVGTNPFQRTINDRLQNEPAHVRKQAPDAELLREMIDFGIERLLELEGGAATGATFGERPSLRLAQPEEYRDRAYGRPQPGPPSLRSVPTRTVSAR